MAWSIGYSGTCPACGASIHQLADDKPRKTAVWLRCARCLVAGSLQVPDDELGAFRDADHPCPDCGGERERWAASRCPRCGQSGAGDSVRAAD